MPALLNPPLADTAGLTCQQALEVLAKDQTLTPAQQAECAQLASAIAKHPRLGKIVEHVALHTYEAKNGPVGTIDWKTILAWFVANAGTIMQLLLSFIALFG